MRLVKSLAYLFKHSTMTSNEEAGVYLRVYLISTLDAPFALLQTIDSRVVAC
jgi:hypothetical protein